MPCGMAYQQGKETANKETMKMTMNIAISHYIAAISEDDIRAAYTAMMEWSDAPEGAEEDDIDAILTARNLPSLAQRLTAIDA